MSPPDPTPAAVASLLQRCRQGEASATAELSVLLYTELRHLARGHLRDERGGTSVQPSALVHEACLRLTDQSSLERRDQAFFLATASNTLRRILVDHARRKQVSKRGRRAAAMTFDEALAAPDRPAAVLSLDDALNALAGKDARKAQAIELRFFGGLSVDETANVLGTSVAEVGRELKLAQAWLRREMPGRERERARDHRRL
jgi:RNA polymerase sigma factor (TIGR02999 family)